MKTLQTIFSIVTTVAIIIGVGPDNNKLKTTRLSAIERCNN